MTLTMWVFAISGTLLILLTALEVLAARSYERPAYLRVLSYGSGSLERMWDWATSSVENVGFYIASRITGGVQWLLSHGIEWIFAFVRSLFIRVARMARSRGVIKKRGAASLFLKQVSEHKRQNPGEIEG